MCPTQIVQKMRVSDFNMRISQGVRRAAAKPGSLKAGYKYIFES